MPRDESPPVASLVLLHGVWVTLQHLPVNLEHVYGVLVARARYGAGAMRKERLPQSSKSSLPRGGDRTCMAVAVRNMQVLDIKNTQHRSM